MLIFKKEMIGKATMETFLEMIMGIARARTGGGGMQPPVVFMKWPPNGWADRAEILHILGGILFATFGKTKIERVRSCHRAMAS